MDRYEFMWKLKSLLSDIPEQEREEALQYYNDYFEDAGKENEASVIASLGSPEKVAENIKKDVGQNHFDDEYENAKVEKGNELVEYSYVKQEEQWRSESKEKKESGGMSVALIILLICVSPILLAIGAAVLSIMAGLVLACVVMVVSFGAATFGLLVGAIVCVVTGILCLPIHLFVGIAVIGTGFLLVALGLLFLMMSAGIGGLVLPKLSEGIGWLLRSCLGRKRECR